MPKVEYRWTLGNILALAGMGLQILILGGGGLWYASQLEGRVTGAAAAIDAVSEATSSELSQIRRDVQTNANRLQAVELNYGRMDERLISIQSIVANIDRKLERLGDMK